MASAPPDFRNIRVRHSIGNGNLAKHDGAVSSVEFGAQHAATAYLIFGQIVNILTASVDTITTLVGKVYHVLAPYDPEMLATGIYGLTLCFFGGVFMTTLAAAEAARMFGSDKFIQAVQVIAKEWGKAEQAIEEENRRDAHPDQGTIGLQNTARDTAFRRLAALSRSVDPENLSSALGGLGQASLAVLATLRIQLAKAITIGTLIGDEINARCSPWVFATLNPRIPEEYKKWVPVISRYLARWIGVALSWTMVRVTASAYSATRGSSLFLSALSAWLVRRGHIKVEQIGANESMYRFAGYTLVLMGVYWQVSSGFKLGFPMNLFLFPLTIIENLLTAVVGYSGL